MGCGGSTDGNGEQPPTKKYSEAPKRPPRPLPKVVADEDAAGQSTPFCSCCRSISEKLSDCPRCKRSTCDRCRNGPFNLVYVFNGSGSGSFSSIATSHVCDRCAAHPALHQLKDLPALPTSDHGNQKHPSDNKPSSTSTSSSVRLFGLQLLQNASCYQEANQCVDRASCGCFTMGPRCYRCHFPAITTKPRKTVRVDSAAECRNGEECKLCADINTKEFPDREQDAKENHGKEKAELVRKFLDEKHLLDAIAQSDRRNGAFNPALLVGEGAPFATQKLRTEALCAAFGSGLAYCYARSPYLSFEASADCLHNVGIMLHSSSTHTTIEFCGKLIVVAFPGTHNIRGMIIDAKATREEVKAQRGTNKDKTTLKIHQGFYEEAYGTVKEALPTSEIAEYVKSGYRVVFTGHSLGGAIAALTTLRLLDDDEALFKGRISCVCYAAPMVGNRDLAKYIDANGWSDSFHSIVHGADIVCCSMVLAGSTLKRAGNAVKSAVESISEGFVDVSGFAKQFIDHEETKTGDELDEESDHSTDEDNEDDPDSAKNRKSHPTKLGRRFRPLYDCFGSYHFIESAPMWHNGSAAVQADGDPLGGDPATADGVQESDSSALGSVKSFFSNASSRVSSSLGLGGSQQPPPPRTKPHERVITFTADQRKKSFYRLRHCCGQTLPSFSDHLFANYAFLLRGDPVESLMF